MPNSHGRLPEASLNTSGMRRGLGISATSPYTDQCSDRCSDHTDQAPGPHSCHGNLRISGHIQLAIPGHSWCLYFKRLYILYHEICHNQISVPSKVPNLSFHFSLGRYSTSKHMLLSLKFLRIQDPTFCLTSLTHSLNRRDFSPGQLSSGLLGPCTSKCCIRRLSCPKAQTI